MERTIKVTCITPTDTLHKMNYHVQEIQVGTRNMYKVLNNLGNYIIVSPKRFVKR